MQAFLSPLSIGRPIPGLTAGSVLYGGAGGVLAQDNAGLSYDGTRLTATGLIVTNAPTFSALTAGRVPFSGTAGLLSDSANLTYSETGSYGSGPKFQIGSGSTTSAGWVFGYYASGVPGIWPTSVTSSNVNYSFAHTSSAGGTTVMNGVGAVSLCANNVEKVSIGNLAGIGPSITAGTAASAVSALSLTQTWNYNSAAINAVDWTFTDTSSHANTNALRIRGGASGTTSLLELSKAGQILAGPGITLAGNGSFDAVATNIGFVQYATRELAVRVGSDGKVIKMDGARLGVGANMSVAFNANADATVGAFDSNFSRISPGLVGAGTGAAGSYAGSLKLTDLITNNPTYIVRTATTLTDVAGAGAGTLTNAPSAGNPTKWIGFDDNGTLRKIPTWT